MVNYPPKKMIAIALLVVLIMVLSSAFAGGNMLSTRTMTTSNAIPNSNSIKYNIVSQLDKEKFSIVPASPSSVDGSISTAFNGSVSVIVTFSFNNQSRLNSLLSNLSNSESSGYHKFMTRSQFTDNFSVSQSVYSQAVSYLSQYSGISVKTYEDRVSIQVTGPAGKIGDLLNTSIVTNSNNRSRYFAAAAPELPSSLATYVSQVTGLSNAPAPIQYNMETGGQALPKGAVTSLDGGYPAPSVNGGTQYIYGSDLQVAYDEQSLLNITYPTNEVIATILWAGTNSSGAPVGAFDPSDIYAYYNATLPPYEPHSKVYGVPLNGAAKPGVSASYDVTGANDENTLDLEMTGSTAPGSNIYNVYGPNATFENLDASFAFILNPNSSYPALNNVSVITNSWGGTEYNNTAWYQYLQEAQARGITVLASSGDSGDNNQSSKYVGSTVEFPSAMAYNNFGVTAVGGNTLTLTDNLHILNETAWYESNLSTDGNPAGSTGGISGVFKEPAWQLDTEANKIIKGKGRGVPDISAIANNTIVYLTKDGVSYYGNPNFYIFGGTSVASPVEAGIIAEIDAVLNHYNRSNLGYLNPLIYSLANKQVAPMSYTAYTGYVPTGNYNSTLPTLPFYNVMYGRNHVYNATYGYNLVTGWGSIDAYNLSMYVLNINRRLSPNGLKGVDDVLSLTGLNVSSYLYNSTTGTYNIVNTFYNASIQQNLFLANQFGAPIYWIQNVIYINGSQATGWVVNYTGWVVYPFSGQYPSQTVYEYTFPLGKIISMPHTFNVRTWITNISKPMQQTVNFEVNSHIVTLPVPGSAYIIDAYNYSYELQGHTYYNGPFPDNPYYGGLNPQFGLVGGPSAGLGLFKDPTFGSVSAYAEPLNMNSYIPAITKVFNESIDETGESAEFLTFTSINESSWAISTKNDSVSQGIVDYPSSQYSQVFFENGLPSGTEWSIIINGIAYSSNSNNITLSLINGSYNAKLASASGYLAVPSGYVFTVNGQSNEFPINFVNSSNETYVRPVATIYPANGQVLKGSTLNLSYLDEFISFGMAYDNRSGMLFIPDFSISSAERAIFAYNTSTNKIQDSISIPAYDAVYDPTTGLVYAISSTGNISEINPYSFAIIKNVSMPGSSPGNVILIQQNGNYIYALNSNGNISQMDASTLAIVKTIYIGPENEILPLFVVNNGNAYIANSSGNYIMAVNFTTSTIKDIYMPPDYTPEFVVNYFGSELLIGGENYSNEIYNVSNGSLFKGPYISNIAISSTYDSISHLVYIFSIPFSSLSLGNITAVNPSDGKIISRIPGMGAQSATVFDLTNQNIYTDNLGGFVSEYSVQHYYSITFTESGLPSGSAWYVNLTNGMDSGPITGSSYSISLANGTYSYTVASANKVYSALQSSSSVTINGAPVSVPVTFSKITYKATFTESGLPSGTTWYVNLSNGIDSGPITGSSYSFSLTNGTYSYTVAASGRIYGPSPSSGSVTVNGATVSKSVAFSEIKYTVTFTESGLPSGTTWYVNLSNGVDSGAITGSLYSFSLTNGTYSYTIATSDKTYQPSPSSGSLTVNGAPVFEYVTFSKVLYNVTFTESGLPSGAEWYVNGTGVSGHEMSPANITFNLANGTYSFTATNLSNYYTTTVHFTVVISGSNATETVDYYHWAYIAGKVSPTNATVTINGKAVSLTSSGSFNVSVANGTYHVVASSSGYTSYYNNFTLNSGSSKNLTINLKPISKPSTISSTELYAIIGVVVAVIVGVMFAMRRR